MPCYSPPMHYDSHGILKDGEILQEEFNQLVRMLCEANKLLDAYTRKTADPRSNELRDWWEDHQRFDAQSARKGK